MGIKLKGLNLGYLGLDYEMMVFPHPDYMLNPQRKKAEKVWYQCPVISYAIEHPDGLILWETGMSTQWMTEWLEPWQGLVDLSGITPEVCLDARLKLAGYAVEDFKYVIQGHLHCDHAGGLRLFEDAGATVVCHEDEYKAVQQVETADNFFVRADWDFLGKKEPMLVYGDQEIMSEVHLVSLPGHTPGTMGLLTKLDHTGWVLLTTDALYTHESYGPPAIGSPVTWSVEKWAESVEKVRQIAVDHDAFVFPGHDETGVKQTAAGVEFRPIQYLPGYVYE
jgi:glyoxylase-like metal-dependent hydrolase (beta-lactamase superfamily II)